MVFLEFLEPRANLETYWEPQLDLQDGMVYLDTMETRESQEPLEDVDYLVGQRDFKYDCS